MVIYGRIAIISGACKERQREKEKDKRKRKKKWERKREKWVEKNQNPINDSFGYYLFY